MHSFVIIIYRTFNCAFYGCRKRINFSFKFLERIGGSACATTFHSLLMKLDRFLLPRKLEKMQHKVKMACE